VIDDGGAVSEYDVDELDERSRATAGALAALGVGKGMPVGIVLRPGVEWLASLFASIRLGAIAVPLHAGFNAETMSVRLSDMGVTVVCTSNDGAAELAHEPFVCLVVDEQHGSSPDLAAQRPLLHRVSEYTGYALDVSATFAPSDPVVAVFTSGTSGEPKVTLWSPNALNAFETYHRVGLGLTEQTRYLTLANPTWSYGLANGVFGALLAGGTLNLVRAPLSTQVLLQVINAQGIELLSLTPMHLRAIVRDLRGTTPPVDSLQAIYSAGERLSDSLAAEASALLGCSCLNGYGLTEIGMPIADRWATDAHLRERARVLPGFEISILDPTRRPVPLGSQGEIGILTDSSLFWFDGYFRDQPRTRANFSPDGKYFLTGDLGVAHPDGSVECVGRLDELIVLPELRVHPVEIEAAVHKVMSAYEVGVVGVPATEGTHQVVVFFGGGGPQSSRIDRDELAGRLVATGYGHLAPDVVRYVDRLPRTASGKLQRARLAALYDAEGDPK
jgi:acetyl-CoA synthetase